MGPISNIGPKTSRIARDRPELNLEAKFSRRNNLPEIVAGRRPPPHSARHKAARCRAKRGACSAQRFATSGACRRPACSYTRAIHGAQQRGGHSNITQPVRKIGGQRPASEWRNGLRTTAAIGRATWATIARPAHNEVRAAAGHARHHARPSARDGPPHEAAAGRSGESSTRMHRLLHASGSHPIPPPNDPKRVGKRVKVRRLSCRVSMKFRVVRTNQYNQDLGLIHLTNGNHLESPNEGSSIDHQVTIYLHAQNITMLPTNETWYFASQILVSSSGGLILILTAQSTRN
ncbi:hypothetical protein F511_41295 [Dorcoceras hygrometricum]|uniref:Uncharacterized protein n=1 Tax=Dorcoceras hygrometricum TaxID=472368 RepID=A0A2Z7C2W2_9LAMI|nr:hypothetical protein F511_41295 [Dorcoceras hygrometricum]